MSYEPKILFHGSKNFWRTKTNLEVTLAYHSPFNKIEILAEDPASTSFEDAERRMYIDVPTLKRQLDHDVLEREALYAQANLYDQKIYTEYDEIYLDILLKLGKDYLLSRLQMHSSVPNSPATSSSQHMSPSSSHSHHPQTAWSLFLQPLPKDEIDSDTGRPAVQCDRPLELEPIRCHRHAAYAAHAPHDSHYRSSELPSLLVTPDHKRSRTPPPATPASTPSSYYGHSAASTSSGALPAFPAHGKHDSAHHNNSNGNSNGNHSHLHAQLQGAVELDAQFALQAPPGTRRPSIGTSTSTSTSTSTHTSTHTSNSYGKKGGSGGTSAPRTLAPLHLPTPSPSSIASPSALPFSNLAKVHRSSASTSSSTSTTPAHRSHPQPLPSPSPLASPRTPEVVATAEEKSCNNNISPKSPAQHKDSFNESSDSKNTHTGATAAHNCSASSQQDAVAQASAQAGTFFAAAVVRAYSNQSNTCNNNNSSSSPGRVNPSLAEASAQAFSSDEEEEVQEERDGEGEREGEDGGVRGCGYGGAVHMAGEASAPQHARWADEVRGASDFDYALQEPARAKKPPPQQQRGTNATRRSREKLQES